MISFDCRGHGQTHPVGPDEKISLATFADDLLGLMDHLDIERAVVGGISMGAAIALNFALRHPARVRALILQRPAWLDAPRHENVEIYSMMAQLIRRHGPLPGLDLFKESAAFKNVLAESPLAAKSMIGYFLDPRAAETVALLEIIPLDSPHPDRAAWRALRVPTLVLANRQDQVHPYEYGTILAEEIPGAEFNELTPKAVSVERHNAEVPAPSRRLFASTFLKSRPCWLMLKCSTSLWSADLSRLADEIKRVEPYSERFHLDVADGHYVSSLLFFPDLVKALRPIRASPLRSISWSPIRWAGLIHLSRRAPTSSFFASILPKIPAKCCGPSGRTAKRRVFPCC